MALATGACCGLEREVLFAAPPLRPMPPDAPGVLVDLDGPQGSTVVALWVAARPAEPTLVFFHGNGQELSDLAPLARDVAALGLGFFAVEYPGYGLSRGSSTEATLVAAADAAVRALERRGVAREKVVLTGYSLGTGVAAEMARRGLGGKLVLLAPYTSIPDLADALSPGL